MQSVEQVLFDGDEYGKGSIGKGEKYVVDTAPTGHALRLLSSPILLDEWIKMAAKMRWKYRYMIESFSVFDKGWCRG